PVRQPQPPCPQVLMLASSRLTKRRRPVARPSVEVLEPRDLPSGIPPVVPLLVTESEPNDVVASAQPLTLNAGALASVVGTVGDGAAGAADVDFYQIQLTVPTRLTLRVAARAPGLLSPVLGLYDDSQPGTDPTSPFGHRLLAQQEGGADLTAQ